MTLRLVLRLWTKALPVLLSVVAGTLLTLLVSPFAIEHAESKLYDRRLGLRVDHGWPDDLVLVPIDDAAQHMTGNWPWKRTLMRDLVSGVEKAGARTILLTGLMSNPTNDADDRALASALGRTVSGMSYSDYDAKTKPVDIARFSIPREVPREATFAPEGVILPLPIFSNAALGIGHVYFPPVEDHVIRGFHPMVKIRGVDGSIPSAALLAWMKQRGMTLEDIRVDGDRLLFPGGRAFELYNGEMFLDFVPGGPQPRAILASDVLHDFARVRDSHVLDGKLAVIYPDSYSSGQQTESPLGGVAFGRLLAYAIRTLDGGHSPTRIPRELTLLVAMIAAIVAFAIAEARGPTAILYTTAAVAFGLASIAFALGRELDRFAPMISPAALVVLSGGIMSTIASRRQDRDRARLRALLAAASSRVSQVAAQQNLRPDDVPTNAIAIGKGAGADAEPARPTGSAALLLAGKALEQPIEIGQYLVTRSLGKGGMGAIFLATDRELGRPVAIKVLETTKREAFVRFRREALAVARVVHPNVVAVYEVGFDSEAPYIVMEYVPGGSLLDLLKKTEGDIPWKRASRLVAGIARGLGAAHAAGIVHRDVKPANMLLLSPESEIAKMADFGIAKLEQTDRLTREGLVVGTIGYLSPEQAMGKPVDARSDVYSLGLTWYRLLTGRSAFSGTTAEVLHAPLRETVDDPRMHNPEIPPAISTCLAAFVEIDPANRPRNGAAAAEWIESIVGRPAPE